jgi:polyribonucleotide nucleotidyltransferase
MKQTATVELAGGKTLSLETGHLAKQAQGSCITRMGDNVVIGTACCAPDPREGIDFFPLTVDYRVHVCRWSHPRRLHQARRPAERA